MSHYGEVSENPITGERAVCLTDPFEHPDQVLDPGIRFVQLVGTFFGLARDGKATKEGLPKPLQLAVSVNEYRDTIVIASPPAWVQRLVFGLLAPIGRSRGLQPYYQRYVDSEVVVEPDPAALALLDGDGRLRRDA